MLLAGSALGGFRQGATAAEVIAARRELPGIRAAIEDVFLAEHDLAARVRAARAFARRDLSGVRATQARRLGGSRLRRAVRAPY